MLDYAADWTPFINRCEPTMRSINQCRFKLASKEAQTISVLHLPPLGTVDRVRLVIVSVVLPRVTIFVRSQVVVWVASPAMIRAGSTTAVMTVLLVAFLLEYLPKIYHSVRVLRRMQDVSGYLFGTIWWGIALNLMAYFVAAHVSRRPVRPLPSHRRRLPAY